VLRTSDLSRILFVLLPRPPRPPLFPYTTLFRSGVDPVVGRNAAVGRVHPRQDGGVTGAGHRHAVGLIAVARDQALIGQGLEPAGDRKSTRLNSSHVKISYAVFCLKKKITAIV